MGVMRLLLALTVLAVGPASAMEAAFGVAAAQLTAASHASASAGLESSSLEGGRWADARASSGLAAESGEDSPSVWPPSPRDASDPHEGFTAGFAYGFAAAEWLPNLVANAAAAGGKSVGGVGGAMLSAAGTVAGGALGLAMLPVGLALGAVGGVVSLLSGLF